MLGELPALTRLLFAGIWTICDREGRLEDRPKKIRAEILPYDQCDADEMLTALDKAGFIKRYQVDGIKVIQVLAWSLHQNPHMKEAPSTLPVYVEHQTSTIQEQCLEQPLPERAGLIPSLLIPDSLNLVVVTKEKTAPRKRGTAPIAKPDDVEQQTWDDWVALRVKKRATVSQTVVDESRLECAKAGLSLERFLKIWCMRGSQGLQADWLKPNEINTGPAETTYQRSKREQMERDFPNLTKPFTEADHVAATLLG